MYYYSIQGDRSQGNLIQQTNESIDCSSLEQPHRLSRQLTYFAQPFSIAVALFITACVRSTTGGHTFALCVYSQGGGGTPRQPVARGDGGGGTPEQD